MAKMPPEVKQFMDMAIDFIVTKVGGVKGYLVKQLLKYGGQWLWDNHLSKWIKPKPPEEKQKSVVGVKEKKQKQSEPVEMPPSTTHADRYTDPRA